MLRRKIRDQLIKWKENEPKKAVCIFGARQIGKTTTLHRFGKENFQHMIEINFLDQPETKKIFQNEPSTDQIIQSLLLYAKLKPEDSDIFLFLDEIQECPEARTAVKFLVQDGRFRVAESGSLLGVHLEQVKSVPVGFELNLNMYPLDFEEFLWALDTGESIIHLLKECMQEEKTVPEYIHSQLMQRYLHYLVVGGMPEVVSRYLQNKNISEVIELQKNIIYSFNQDITKYADKTDRIKIEDVFSQIPAQLNKQNQRFILNKIQKGARYSYFAHPLLWITKAGLGLPCLNTEEPQIPLLLNGKRNLFKLFYLDTGLLCSCYEGIQLPLLRGDTSLNWGAVLENAVAQAFSSSGFELFYFSSKKYGEIDFVLQQGQRIILAEIKSGANYEKHPSLDKIRAVSNWSFADSIVFCRDNVQRKNGILYLPWYMMGFLSPQIQDQEWPEFNFEALELSQ